MRHVRFLIVMAVALMAAGCVRAPPRAPMAASTGSDLDALAYGQLVVATPVAQKTPQKTAREVSRDTATAYALDTGDRLRVVVYGQDGLTNSYSVDAGGNITMPLIGAVKARGLSLPQLSDAIAAKLRQGFIREPYVAAEIEAYRPFFILGEVTYPGQYPYVVNMTVETAVAIAGGYSPRAKRDKVQISRNVQGQQTRWCAPATTPVNPGDTIVVAERWF